MTKISALGMSFLISARTDLMLSASLYAGIIIRTFDSFI